MKITVHSYGEKKLFLQFFLTNDDCTAIVFFI